MSDLVVFTARRIGTMEPSTPVADAIAVRDGRIVEVGSIETMRPWLDSHAHEIDDTFRDHVIMPGFVDPHLHPSMAAILLPMHFVTAFEWSLPWGDVSAVTNRAELLERLTDLDRRLEADEPLFAWGHHHIWHGEVDRETLNAPIWCWSPRPT